MPVQGTALERGNVGTYVGGVGIAPHCTAARNRGWPVCPLAIGMDLDDQVPSVHPSPGGARIEDRVGVPCSSSSTPWPHSHATSKSPSRASGRALPAPPPDPTSSDLIARDLAGMARAHSLACSTPLPAHLLSRAWRSALDLELAWPSLAASAKDGR
jgi:hypothetical protein